MYALVREHPLIAVAIIYDLVDKLTSRMVARGIIHLEAVGIERVTHTCPHGKWSAVTRNPHVSGGRITVTSQKFRAGLTGNDVTEIGISAGVHVEHMEHAVIAEQPHMSVAIGLDGAQTVG